MFHKHLLQTAIQRSLPRFSGHSYVALPMTTDKNLSSIRIMLKPQFEVTKTRRRKSKRRGKSLILHSKRFILLLDELNRIELRYLDISKRKNSDSETRVQFIRVIGSRDVENDKWNELLVTDNASNENINSIYGNSEPLNKIVLVIPSQIELRPDTFKYHETDGSYTSEKSVEMFLGSIPKPKQVKRSSLFKRQKLFGNLTSLAGFVGCIAEVSLNERVYNLRSDLGGDILDGFDIGEFIE